MISKESLGFVPKLDYFTIAFSGAGLLALGVGFLLYQDWKLFDSTVSYEQIGKVRSVEFRVGEVPTTTTVTTSHGVFHVEGRFRAAIGQDASLRSIAPSNEQFICVDSNTPTQCLPLEKP